MINLVKLFQSAFYWSTWIISILVYFQQFHENIDSLSHGWIYADQDVQVRRYADLKGEHTFKTSVSERLASKM
jgi:hypothetical protein